MCRQTSALNKVAFSVLILGCVLTALSFSAPFWVRVPDNWSLQMWDKVTYRGLWGTCCPDKEQTVGYSCVWVWQDFYTDDNNMPPCTWVWSKNYESAKIPAWYQAAQIIFCIAIGFLFIAILLQSIYNCCRCCTDASSFPTVVASAAISGAVLAGLSLGVYGGFSYQEGVFAPTLSGGKSGQLEWAFYVGVAGAGTCFIASLLFFIDGCIHATKYRDYKSPVLGTQ